MGFIFSMHLNVSITNPITGECDNSDYTDQI